MVEIELPGGEGNVDVVGLGGVEAVGEKVFMFMFMNSTRVAPLGPGISSIRSMSSSRSLAGEEG